MIALIQRVSQASVVIDGKMVGQVDAGLLALIGVQPNDNQTSAEKLLQKVINYRVFADSDGKMNLSLNDVGGGLLLVPQFTLAADTQSGRRPSFTTAAAPTLGQELFETLMEKAQQQHHSVASGQFGADMKVSLINDGPVTFWLEAH